MTIKNNIVIRAYCFYILAVIVGALIIGKIIVIQFTGPYNANSSAQYIEIESIPGNIYSVDNKILATTVASYELRIDMGIKHIDNDNYDNIIDSIGNALSQVIDNTDKNSVKQKLLLAKKNRNRYFLLKSGISIQSIQKLKTYPIFQKSRNKTGLIIVKKLKRIYPFNNMALRTIGYANSSHNVGIEGAYNYYLTSENIKVPIIRGLGGATLPLDADYLGLNRGNDIMLTIDTKLQSIVQEALLKTLLSYKAEGGTAILMEVSTGKIKAISNFLKNIDDAYLESFNMAIGSSIEPGSTFKLASIMAGLEDKKFTIDSIINIEDGTTKFYNHVLKDSSKPAEQNISIQEAFKRSSNVGIAKAIWKNYKNNPQQFINRLKQFHMNAKLGLDIKGEGAPVVKTPKDPTWSKISLPWMAIGYEVLQTPLNILALYNTVANNGKMLKPQFVEKILDNNETLKEFEPIVIDKKICTQETLNQAQKLLKEAGKAYSQHLGENLYYSIAGKTGTAQIATSNKGYKIKGQKIKYRASFVGYFPSEKPQYSIIVMINVPQHSYYGSQVALPVFRDIVNDIYMINSKDFKDIKHITLNELKPIK